MDHLVRVVGFFLIFIMTAKDILGEEQSEVFEVRIFTTEINNKSKDAAIRVKIFGIHGDTASAVIPSRSPSADPVSQFGKFGLDVYNVTVTPAIGSPTKISVTQQDPLKQMTWHLNKVLIVDSKAFHYEFLVNKVLNSSTTPTGEASVEVHIFDTYGGPNTMQSKGCIGDGSQVWYLDNHSNIYKPAKVTGLNPSDATITTASGHIVTVPRDQHHDGIFRPAVVNDDWLKLTMSLNDKFIAAFNQTGEFYLGTSTYVSSESLTTIGSHRKYSWEHYMFHVRYDGSNEEKNVRGGNIRKINQISTKFCTDQELSIDDSRAFDVLFTCDDSRMKLEGHVITAVNARDLMHCGMVCARHVQCVSFNFCDITTCSSSSSNCELNNSIDGYKNKRAGGFQICVLVKRF